MDRSLSHLLLYGCLVAAAVACSSMSAYLDHAATTPMRPEAVEAMLPYLSERFGNPSGGHTLARDARRALDDARDQMAEALGCQPGEVVFTSGGTEADNQAVHGVLARQAPAGRSVAVAPAFEHHAVLHPVERAGGRIVAVGPDGVVDLDALAAALDPDVAVVSVMLANNESGVVQPLSQVADLVRRLAPGAVLHTDAVQAFLWLDVAELAAPAGLVSVSAHKFGGPKGVGALVVRDGTPVDPLMVGGGQERERRSGTQNVAGIVAMAAAARSVLADRKALVDRAGAWRDRLADTLLRDVPGVSESGVTGVAADRSHKVAGSCHLLIEDVESEALLFLLDQAGICASAASSCASGAMDPSHVLAAMGVDRELAGGSLRLTLGWSSTEADVDAVLDALPGAVDRLRRLDR
jgi:cysteine desulfurase